MTTLAAIVGILGAVTVILWLIAEHGLDGKVEE